MNGRLHAWFPLLFLSLIALLSACSSNAPTDADAHAELPEIASAISYITQHQANGDFSGSLLIAKGDEVLLDEQFGFLDATQTTFHSDTTCYLIGSITKPFAALTILLLEQEGSLSLDDRLSKYFPDYPRAEEVSIRQLLGHTSGVPDYHRLPNWLDLGQQPEINTDSTIRLTHDLPYDFDPGSRFRYSNTGYLLLGRVVEKVTQLSFQEAMSHYVTGPMGLENTGVATDPFVRLCLPPGHESTPRDPFASSVDVQFSQPFASGNMYSTPRDLWMFTRAFMHGDVLPKPKLEEVLSDSNGRYGFGWGIRNFEGLKAFGHHGMMNGFCGSITWFPESEVFICILTNDFNTPKYTISEGLTRIMHGMPYESPEGRALAAVPDAQKELICGDYLVKPGDTLRIYQNDSRVFLQETGQPAFELYPFANRRYQFAMQEFIVAFDGPSDQRADTLRFEGQVKLAAGRVGK